MKEFDTITAISTGLGSGIAIVRISGDKSMEIINKIFFPNRDFESHRIYYGHIKDEDEIVDEVLVSFFLDGKSYTKEDVVEINCHGGHKATEKVLELILSNGARMAEPGEFTKRAFLNGRIDLSEAEAVIDIINAKTDLSHKSAVNRLEGKLSKKIRGFADRILILIANIEASIDYPEHEMEMMNKKEIKKETDILLDEIEDMIRSADTGIILKDGIKTVILGKPNVGKSSLLNAILEEDRAIVTDIPGTTRDILSEYVNIKGVPLRIMDTAGIRDTQDTIEKVGVEKALESAETAGLILYVIDNSLEIDNKDIELIKSMENYKKIIIINKIDLDSKIDMEKLELDAPIIEISAKNNIGIEKLFTLIYNMFINEDLVEGDVLVSSVRNKTSLINGKNSLLKVKEGLEMDMPEDLISIDLVDSYRYLMEITGENINENIINKIFEEFCLGK